MKKNVDLQHSFFKPQISMRKILALLPLPLLFAFSSYLKNNSYEQPELLREPYLQMVRENSATITWKTNDITENCYVEIQKETSNKIISKQGKLTQHEKNTFNEVVFDKLEPNTKYYYSIFSNGYKLATGKKYFFITNPKKGKTAFTFYALGDIGAKLPHSFADKPAKCIEKLNHKPSFGLGLGDIVYPKGESRNYDKQLFLPFENIFKNTPFYPVPGNHDWYTDPEKNFEKEWSLPNNEHYYSFSYSNALFIGLDSSKGEFYNYKEQVAWLQKTLNENKDTFDWTIVYLHHNGKTCSYKPNYEAVISIYKILAENKVDLLLNGHAHTYERLKPYNKEGDIDTNRTNHSEYKNLDENFISITVGAGGKLNNKWEPNPSDKKNCENGDIVAHYEHEPSFSLISIDGKTLKFEGINSINGKTFDSFTINK